MNGKKARKFRKLIEQLPDAFGDKRQMYQRLKKMWTRSSVIQKARTKVIDTNLLQ